MVNQVIAEIPNREELKQQVSRRLEEWERRHVAAVRNMRDQNMHLIVQRRQELAQSVVEGCEARSTLETTRAQLASPLQEITSQRNRLTEVQERYQEAV